MDAHQRILENAFDVPSSASFGEGGKAVAAYYKSKMPTMDECLSAMAIMLNGLADAEKPR